MRAEIFLKNGRKITVDDVTQIIDKTKEFGFIQVDYERKVSQGEFTTCDMPSEGYESANIDMIKLVGFE